MLDARLKDGNPFSLVKTAQLASSCFFPTQFKSNIVTKHLLGLYKRLLYQILKMISPEVL